MLTNEDLQAISGLITSAVTASEGRMMARMDKIDARLDNMDARLDNMDTRLDNAVNALVEWAEQVAVITKAPFPVQHQPVVEP
ncbi:hypothetical protein [Allofournierella sp.]|uniref:hypothetical protein n=1 Tax=Allofournierella sp. TaxID=1940256 RepID=UPI002E76E969|nr:hypothetical protein [Fournierella sp.]MEE0756289.1 hypothetical protein [Fournierella sp.]